MKTLIATSLMTATLATPVAAADLQVTIKRVPNDQGVVRFAIYSAETYLKGPASRQFQWLMHSHKGKLTHVFKDLPAGRYAVVVFQDQNNNGRLDRSALGIPTEKVAFSNDAVGASGPPSFDQAAFTLASQGRAINLTFD